MMLRKCFILPGEQVRPDTVSVSDRTSECGPVRVHDVGTTRVSEWIGRVRDRFPEADQTASA